MSYFVFGLPRSRTAWLSCFLSQSGKFCYHEAINGCINEKEYMAKMQGFGDSTTAFSHCPESLYKNGRVVIIEKTSSEFDRCVEWCSQAFNVNSRLILENMRDELMAIKGMRVLQSDIDDKLPDIFEYLTGSRWQKKYGCMKWLNIQADPSMIDYGAMRAYTNA